MSSDRCAHCGKSASVGSEVCSSGCGLARQLPWGDGDLPATWQLGVALAWGFAVFNQALFAGVGLLASNRNEPEMAANFVVASVVVGVLVTLVNGFFFVVAKPKRLSDGLAIGVAALGGVGVWYELIEVFSGAAALGFGVFNLLFSMWLARGLRRGRASKKGQKG